MSWRKDVGQIYLMAYDGACRNSKAQLRKFTEEPIQGDEINPIKAKGSKTTARGRKYGLTFVKVRTGAGL